MALSFAEFDNLTIYYLTIDMTELELKERFKKFSIRIIKMVDSMPDTISGRAIGSQVVRSGTSPAANYRAACLGKSEKDFLNKLKMVEEEMYLKHFNMKKIIHCVWFILQVLLVHQKL